MVDLLVDHDLRSLRGRWAVGSPFVTAATGDGRAGVSGRHPRCHVPLSWYIRCVLGEVMWTEDSEAHIGRHNVTPLEVEQVLYGQPRLAVPGRDDTTEVLGQTDAGRLLLVVVTQAGDGRDFVVTARNMTTTERRAFQERSR
jgi:uncharacterized DUF497 family protein